MAMPFKRNSILPRDITGFIKLHCWDNISEFYRRYKEQLGVSQATFYRALSGDYSSEDTIDAIMRVVRDNKIGLNEQETSAWEIKKIYVREMFRLIDILLDNPSLTNLSEIRIFSDKHRSNLE